MSNLSLILGTVMGQISIFLMGLMGVIAAPVAVLFSTPVQEGEVVLVVASPWDNPIDIIANAGGDFIGPETAPIAAFASSEAPELEARLMRAGAWAVLSGAKLSKLCGV